MTINPDILLYRAGLAMKLGEVNRATRHPCNTIPESDTTHTVMLQLACLHVYDSVGRQMDLDLGLLLRHALVHDLPEALCGDTVTIRPLTAEERAEKERRELEAWSVIDKHDPQLGDHIENYESEKSGDFDPADRTLEAEIVHILDKLTPRLTHVLNNGLALDGHLGIGVDEIVDICSRQTEKLMDMHPRCAFLRPVLDHFAQLTFERMRDRIDAKEKVKAEKLDAIYGPFKDGDGVRIARGEDRFIGWVGVVSHVTRNVGHLVVDVFGRGSYGVNADDLERVETVDRHGYPIGLGDVVQVVNMEDPESINGRVGIVKSVSAADRCAVVDVFGLTQPQPLGYSKVEKVAPVDFLEGVLPDELPHGWGGWISCSGEHDGASFRYSHPVLGNELIISIADFRKEPDFGGRQGWVLSMVCGDPEIVEVFDVKDGCQVERMVFDLMEEVGK